MTYLRTDKDAALATQGKSSGCAWSAQRVEIDSRRVQPGDLFVAIKGDRFDGHAFVADAFAKGAAAAVVSRMPEGAADSPLLLVEDTLKALEGLGRYARHRSQAKVVGVTGSVGKTSTKEMIRLALSAHGKVHASSGNFNNHIGTPLGLANLPEDARYAVFEMGMNHAGEISHLTKMVRPDIAVITGVEAVHLEFFASVEGIADAKAEIFDGMNEHGMAILNADNAYTNRLKLSALKRGVVRCIACGESESADCRLMEYYPTPTGCRIDAQIHGKTVNFSLEATGRHWAHTALFALAVAYAFGLDRDKTAAALSTYHEPQGRGGVVHIPVTGGEVLLVDDSYNASPTSMRAAFSKTNEVWDAMGGKGRKIAALGDMLELGEESAALHQGLADDLVKQGFSNVFTAGILMRNLCDALPSAMRAGHTPSAMALLPLLAADLRAGDVLLVKGSHGSLMYELARALTQPLPQQEKKHAV